MEQKVNEVKKQGLKTGSGLSLKELRQFDFSQISSQEAQIFEKLGMLTAHKYLLKIIDDQYGQTRLKEQYVLDNFASLTPAEIADFNAAKLTYNNKIKFFPTLIMVSSTLGAFFYGLWTLPARTKLLKHTTLGFLMGGTLSYFYWRYQSDRFNEAMNIQFKNVLRERYNESLKTRRIRAQSNDQ